MTDSDTVHKYKRISMVKDEEWNECFNKNTGRPSKSKRMLLNKINELVIEYNHLAKDLELYKAAYKQHLVDYHFD